LTKGSAMLSLILSVRLDSEAARWRFRHHMQNGPCVRACEEIVSISDEL